MRTKVTNEQGEQGMTDAEIRALKPRSERFDVSDVGTAGLTLRVWPSGAKRWRVWYRRVDSTTGRLSQGRYGPKAPEVSLANITYP